MAHVLQPIPTWLQQAVVAGGDVPLLCVRAAVLASQAVDQAHDGCLPFLAGVVGACGSY